MGLVADELDPVRIMYDYTQKKIDDKLPYKRPLRFRASEAGDCPRKIWYSLKNFEDSNGFTAFVQHVCDLGDVHHDLVRWRMKHAGIEMFDLAFDEEAGTIVETRQGKEFVRWGDNDILVSYRTDGGVVIDGKRAVLEIKTIDGMSYTYMEKAWKAGELVEYLRGHVKYKKYFLQAAISAKLAGLDYVYLLIENRSLGQIGFGGQNSELFYKVTDADFEDAMNNFSFVTDMITDDTVPMQPYTKSSQPCKFCPHRDRCWKLGEFKE
jgi:CRISPR/Cas system-associated exonuclease Cas4 (RecB family)